MGEIFKLPLIFSKCRDCGCEKTVSGLVVQEMRKGAIPVFTSLRRVITPLENPQTAVLSVPTLIIHYDLCAKCGREYCTKVEIQNAPIKVRAGTKPLSPS